MKHIRILDNGEILFRKLISGFPATYICARIYGKNKSRGEDIGNAQMVPREAHTY
jgi:hypothetical protein